MHKLIALAASAALPFLAGPAHANLLVNGDFSNGLAGWTVSGNVSALDSAFYRANFGGVNDTGTGTFAAFGASDTPDDGVLSQSFQTTKGVVYEFTFFYGAFGHDNAQALAVLENGLTVEQISDTPTTDLSRVLAGPFIGVQFTGDGSVFTLSFKDISSNTLNADGILDSVDLEAVAEPGSLVLFGAGLAALAALCCLPASRFRARPDLGSA